MLPTVGLFLLLSAVVSFAQAPTDVVRGWEFAAAVNLVPKDVKAEATIFIPQNVTRVRAVLVVIKYGLGFQVTTVPRVLKLAEGLDAAILGVQFSNVSPNVVDKGLRSTGQSIHDAFPAVLQRLAVETGHQELTDAPLLFWGDSSGGGAAESFVRAFPERIFAIVLYHSAGGGGDPPKAATQIPTLIFHGGKDTTVLNGSQDFWKRGRSAGAPWTFSVDPDAPHGDEEDLRYLRKANELMIPWITSVLRQRLPASGTTLSPITDASGWLGNNQTGEVAPYANYSGPKAEASWLPDEASARGWQAVLGKGK